MSSILQSVIGLKNLGNSCYMNSTLQILFSSNIFNNIIFLFLKKHPNRSKNINNMLKIYINTIIEISKLSNNNIYNPIDFKTLLGKENILFKNTQQQDAHELLVYLINEFADEKKDEKMSKLIKKLCFGKIKQYVYCFQCQNTSISYHNYFDINLQIPKKNNIDLGDCFNEEFLKVEKLDGDNKYYCSNCKTKVIASKKKEIETVPDVVFILLKRFDNNSKITTPVKIYQNIILENNKLELISTVNHYGGIHGGHYTANVKKNNCWYNANDSSINTSNMPINDPSIYIMVYQKNE